MNEFARYMNGVAILILCGVLFGGFFMQFYYHEEPCPLCLLQRLGMIGVGCGLFLNMRFGISTHGYAISYFNAVLGAAVSIRQIMLHICPGDQPFGLPVFGLSLYTWAFIVFVSVILGISLLLFLYKPEKLPIPPRKMRKFPFFAAVILILFTAANAITTLVICGFGPCTG